MRRDIDDDDNTIFRFAIEFKSVLLGAFLNWRVYRQIHRCLLCTGHPASYRSLVQQSDSPPMYSSRGGAAPPSPPPSRGLGTDGTSEATDAIAQRRSCLYERVTLL